MSLDFLTHAPFWAALGQIIIIDILLGGDNAVVIALACRDLPPAQRTKGIVYGAAGAILLRVIFVIFAMSLLTLPLLKFIGALMLVWIGVKLIAPQEEEGHGNIQSSDRLLAAVKTVIVADVVMSLDNVIAIAGAAQHVGEQHVQVLLIVLALLISIPIIIGGSQLIIGLMDRFPAIVMLGGMLLGWIAGGMLVSDPVFAKPEARALPDMLAWIPAIAQSKTVVYGASAAGALLTLALGRLVAARRRSAARP